MKEILSDEETIDDESDESIHKNHVDNRGICLRGLTFSFLVLLTWFYLAKKLKKKKLDFSMMNNTIDDESDQSIL